MRLSRTISILAVSLGLLGVPRALFAVAQDATVTVTPVADVSLTLSATTYAFGPQAVNTSSNSAVGLTLTNAGQVSVKVSKQITVQSSPAGWTAGNAAGLDTYALYCSTAASRPLLSDYGAATLFGAQGNSTALTGGTGTQPILPAAAAQNTATLWFRLDTPTTISSGLSRTITVEFTGTAQ